MFCINGAAYRPKSRSVSLPLLILQAEFDEFFYCEFIKMTGPFIGLRDYSLNPRPSTLNPMESIGLMICRARSPQNRVIFFVEVLGLSLKTTT